MNDPALPDEFEADDEVQLFRRRSRSIPVRRGLIPRWIWRAGAWMLVSALVLLGGIYGGMHWVRPALSSPGFGVDPQQGILVQGSNVVSREEILSALRLQPYPTESRRESIFQITLEDARRQIETIPWVRSALVSRVLPNRLVIQIVERTPIAFVNSGGNLKLVDAEGVLLEKPEKANYSFPVVSGLDAVGSAADRQARLTIYQEFLRQVGGSAASSAWMISEIDLSDSDDLKALLVQGRESIQAHFGREEFKSRFQSFLDLLPEMRQTNTQIDSVDLRYRNQVVVNPKKVASG